MNRREFIALVGGSVPWAFNPAASRAQHRSSMPVVGFLGGGTADGYATVIAAIREGLMDLGYVEGKNVMFDFRWADGQYDRLPALAADLVNQNVTVIVTTGGPLPARVAKGATTTIPIVFATGGDPVEHGLVSTLGGSGDNVTGVTFLNTALMPKRLEVILELMPDARAIAMLVNSQSVSLAADMKDIARASLKSGIPPATIIHAAGSGTPETAFAEIVERHIDALLVHPDGTLYSRIREIIALAARHKIPTVYFTRECVERGGLMSYGPDPTHVTRTAGTYAARILRGEKPADLPVQQPTKFELVLNMKTAKALGLTIPPMLLARADEVIE
jgi:putative ABC transport system substrate-binding protein